MMIRIDVNADHGAGKLKYFCPTLFSSAKRSRIEQIKPIHMYGSYTDVFGRLLTNISFDSHNSIILIESHHR